MQNDDTPKPITPPNAYVRMRYTQICECCGSISEHTKLFTRTKIRSHMGTGWIQQTRICDGPPRWNLPVITENADTESLPICERCTDLQVQAHMAKLPTVPLDTMSEAALESTIEGLPPGHVCRRPYEEELQRFRARKARLLAAGQSAPKIRTLDDLISLIG